MPKFATHRGRLAGKTAKHRQVASASGGDRGKRGDPLKARQAAGRRGSSGGIETKEIDVQCREREKQAVHAVQYPAVPRDQVGAVLRFSRPLQQ